MLFSKLTAVAMATALSMTATAQLTTKCNPLKTTCPPVPGLQDINYSIDFTKITSQPSEWTVATYENVTYNTHGRSSGAEFSFLKGGDAPAMTLKYSLFYGRVEYVVQAAPGNAIVSDMILTSLDLDEVDWEFRGSYDSIVQTNYFGKGITGSYNHSTTPSVSNPMTSFHTYTIDWTPTELVWSIDGTPVRTLKAADCIGDDNQFPSSPMAVSLGLWDGVDNSWAGPATPIPPPTGGYTMYVKSVNIWNSSPAQYYNFTDLSGSAGSIKAYNQTKTNGISITANSGSSYVSSFSKKISPSSVSTSQSMTSSHSLIASGASRVVFSQPLNASTHNSLSGKAGPSQATIPSKQSLNSPSATSMASSITAMPSGSLKAVSYQPTNSAQQNLSSSEAGFSQSKQISPSGILTKTNSTGFISSGSSRLATSPDSSLPSHKPTFTSLSGTGSSFVKSTQSNFSTITPASSSFKASATSIMSTHGNSSSIISMLSSSDTIGLSGSLTSSSVVNTFANSTRAILITSSSGTPDSSTISTPGLSTSVMSILSSSDTFGLSGSLTSSSVMNTFANSTRAISATSSSRTPGSSSYISTGSSDITPMSRSSGTLRGIESSTVMNSSIATSLQNSSTVSTSPSIHPQTISASFLSIPNSSPTIASPSTSSHASVSGDTARATPSSIPMGPETMTRLNISSIATMASATDSIRVYTHTNGALNLTKSSSAPVISSIAVTASSAAITDQTLTVHAKPTTAIHTDSRTTSTLLGPSNISTMNTSSETAINTAETIYSHTSVSSIAIADSSSGTSSATTRMAQSETSVISHSIMGNYPETTGSSLSYLRTNISSSPTEMGSVKGISTQISAFSSSQPMITPTESHPSSVNAEKASVITSTSSSFNTVVDYITKTLGSVSTTYTSAARTMTAVTYLTTVSPEQTREVPVVTMTEYTTQIKSCTKCGTFTSAGKVIESSLTTLTVPCSTRTGVFSTVTDYSTETIANSYTVWSSAGLTETSTAYATRLIPTSIQTTLVALSTSSTGKIQVPSVSVLGTETTASSHSSSPLGTASSLLSSSLTVPESSLEANYPAVSASSPTVPSSTGHVSAAISSADLSSRTDFVPMNVATTATVSEFTTKTIGSTTTALSSSGHIYTSMIPVTSVVPVFVTAWSTIIITTTCSGGTSNGEIVPTTSLITSISPVGYTETEWSTTTLTVPGSTYTSAGKTITPSSVVTQALQIIPMFTSAFSSPTSITSTELEWLTTTTTVPGSLYESGGKTLTATSEITQKIPILPMATTPSSAMTAHGSMETEWTTTTITIPGSTYTSAGQVVTASSEVSHAIQVIPAVTPGSSIVVPVSSPPSVTTSAGFAATTLTSSFVVTSVLKISTYTYFSSSSYSTTETLTTTITPYTTIMMTPSGTVGAFGTCGAANASGTGCTPYPDSNNATYSAAPAMPNQAFTGGTVRTYGRRATAIIAGVIAIFFLSVV